MASMFPVTEPYTPARSPPPRARTRFVQPPDSGDLRVDVINYFPALHAYARTLTGNRAHSEDLVQDVAVRALAGAHLFVPGTNLRAWLFTILRNSHFSTFRRRRHLDGGRVEDLPEARLAVPPTQHHALELKDVQRLLRMIPAKQREALLLVSMGELDYTEAAVLRKCSIGTVKSRVHRARAKLNALIDAPSTYRPRAQISLAKPYRRTVVLDFAAPPAVPEPRP
ncbi:MAG: sigma-70 family RNA polymerase sigma factor [Alphaproteobacteria bacterium]